MSLEEKVYPKKGFRKCALQPMPSLWFEPSGVERMKQNQQLITDRNWKVISVWFLAGNFFYLWGKVNLYYIKSSNHSGGFVSNFWIKVWFIGSLEYDYNDLWIIKKHQQKIDSILEIYFNLKVLFSPVTVQNWTK